MAETFVANSSTKDEDIIKGISNETKFFILIDHYNIPPMGGPNVKEYLNGKIAIVDQMIQNYPNCLFILESISEIAGLSQNVIYLPTTLIDSSMFPTVKNFNIDWNISRPKTCNHRDGRPRTSRILTDYWLAKNFPLDQLLYTKKQETDINWIIDTISHSPFENKKHIRPKTFLKENWIEISGGEYYRNSFQFQFIFDYLLPVIILPTYISIQTESNDHYPSFQITEKTYISMQVVTMQLHLGNWTVNKVLNDLGLENFDCIFDHSHLNYKDPYYRTIGGLEKNKKIITNHDLVEHLWQENLGKIKHNHHIIKDSDHWRTKFKNELKLLKEGLDLNIVGDINENDSTTFKRLVNFL